MTYVPVDRILEHIPNKFEAIKVAALECRRLNDKLRALEIHEEEKITTLAIHRLMDGRIKYYDARERREQERSEAMLAAAEEMLDMTAPSDATLAELGAEVGEEETPSAAATGTFPSAAAIDVGVKPPAEEAEEEDTASEEEIVLEADASTGAQAADSESGSDSETDEEKREEGGAMMDVQTEDTEPDAPAEETKD